MALHRTPAEHDANPPSTWEVVKVMDRIWHLRQRGTGYPLESFETKREALAAREHGFFVKLYAEEARRFCLVTQ